MHFFFLFFSILKEFLEEFDRVLSTKLECASKDAEENKKTLDEMSEKLTEVERKRIEVKKKS